MKGQQPGLRLEGVKIILNNRVLIDLTHTVLPGEVFTVMGPSGSGKSSLLAFLGGFLDPAFEAEGQVYLDGEDILSRPSHKRRMGVLFQDPLLFPHMSVGENLLFAVPASPSKQTRVSVAKQALSDSGLPEFFDRDPATLSGGQKSRVALLRVLLAEPSALLLDEPFSKLDTGRRANIRDLIFNQVKKRNLPAILVTHDLADAEAAGGTVLHIEG